MHSSLQLQWNRLEIRRKEYEKFVEKWAQQQLVFKPSAESWSLQQVLAHVVSVEQLSIRSLSRWKNSEKARRKTIGTSLRSFLLRVMLKSPLKFKAPPVPGLLPDEEQSIPALLKEWETSRIQLKQFLDLFPEEKLDFEIYRHPRSGWLTLLQALKFMEDHLRHHQQQLERIVKAHAFPA